MEPTYKIIPRDGGAAVTLYDDETEDIIMTVSAADYKAFCRVAYTLKSFTKMKQEVMV